MTFKPLTAALAVLTAAYPVLVYTGLHRFEPRHLAWLLAGLALARALVARQPFWWTAAGGACLLALLSFAGNALLPLKLYPVLVNAVFLLLFGISLWRPPTVVERMARLTEPDLPPEAVVYTRRVTQVWCVFFLANGGAALATALWASNDAWALYNGLISYLLMGALFCGEWLVRRRVRARIAAGRAAGGAFMIEEWLMLSELLSHPGLEGRAIAWRCGHLVDRSVFLADVLAWFAAFKPCPGPRVALYFDEGYEFACALFGAWHAGKQVVLPGDTQPATLARLLPQVDACAGRLPGALQPAARQVAGGEPLPASLPAIDASRAGVVVHTSGSSGEPLALDKSLSQLDTELRALQAAFGAQVDAQGPAAVHATVSHQHIYGLLFGVLWPLAAGRPFVAERVVYPEDMAARLGPRPSILVTSPAHLTRLPLQLDWQAARTGLQAVFSSGGPLPLAASLAARSLLGRTPIEVYGSSETGGVAWRQQAGQGDVNAAWTPLPGVECRVDSGGGLLDVRSGHLPDASSWFRTADRVRPAEAPDASAEHAADAAGEKGRPLVALSRFVLLGRADRVVKIEEKRVSITALERLLSAADELAEARIVVLDAATRPRLAVVGVPSDAGQALLLAQGKRALNERLRAWLLQGVERVALPRRFRYVARLPVNEQGKTLDARLAALFRPSQPAIEWVSREPSSAVARLDMSPDLLVFDGHFPEAPILPGVAQLDWAIRIGQSCFGEGGDLQHFVRAEALKFQRPVLPGMCVELTLTWRAADRVLAFAYRSEAGLHASGSLVFAVPLPQEVADA